jgi:inner membrane protein
MAVVDSLTQAVLGSAMGALVLGHKLGRRALGWGVAFGTLPDLDALLMPFFDTRWDLRLHRGPTHSLLLIVLLSFLLAKPLAKAWKREKVSPQQAGIFVFLALGTHVLIDVFTVYGTQIAWPFSSYPYSLDNLFIVDPVFTLPLLVAAIWGCFLDFPKWKKGRGLKVTAVAVAISSLYAGLSLGARAAMKANFEADLARRGLKWERTMTAPAPMGILLWRCVVEREGDFWVGYRSLFDGERAVTWTIYQKEAGTLEKWTRRPEVAEVRRFSKDWCLARQTADGVWLMDLRFGEWRNWDAKGVALRPIFAWELREETRDDPMKPTESKRKDPGKATKRMWQRAVGNATEWDDRPRLIGNPSRSSEYLGVLE